MQQLTDADVMQWKLIVYKIAHIYWRKMNMRAELDDYIGEGFLGLIQGLRDYDASRNPNKKAFLGSRITWAIIAAIKRDDPTTRRGYEQGVRIRIEQLPDLANDVFVSTSRELDQCITILDLERLFAVMIDEEKAEFHALLTKAPNPLRAATKGGYGYPPENNARWDAQTFAKQHRFVSAGLVSGFAKMQNVIRLHRTVV